MRIRYGWAEELARLLWGEPAQRRVIRVGPRRGGNDIPADKSYGTHRGDAYMVMRDTRIPRARVGRCQFVYGDVRGSINGHAHNRPSCLDRDARALRKMHGQILSAPYDKGCLMKGSHKHVGHCFYAASGDGPRQGRGLETPPFPPVLH